MILQSAESVEKQHHKKVMKKDILVVVDTAIRSTKQFFLLLEKASI
jgi:hypothetical protein